MWDSHGHLVVCVQAKLLDITRDCNGKCTAHNSLSWKISDWDHPNGEIVWNEIPLPQPVYSDYLLQGSVHGSCEMYVRYLLQIACR